MACARRQQILRRPAGLLDKGLDNLGEGRGYREDLEAGNIELGIDILVGPDAFGVGEDAIDAPYFFGKIDPELISGARPHFCSADDSETFDCQVHQVTHRSAGLLVENLEVLLLVLVMLLEKRRSFPAGQMTFAFGFRIFHNFPRGIPATAIDLPGPPRVVSAALSKSLSAIAVQPANSLGCSDCSEYGKAGAKWSARSILWVAGQTSALKPGREPSDVAKKEWEFHFCSTGAGEKWIPGRV
jgi:hypothetical protein